MAVDKVLTFRLANESDLEDIVQMLADDTLGALREQPQAGLSDTYRNAFEAIAARASARRSLNTLSGELKKRDAT